MRIAVEPELKMLRDALSAPATTSVRPLADQVDRGQDVSWDLLAAVRDLGLTRLPFPEKYGDDGGSIRAYAVGRELLARCGS